VAIDGPADFFYTARQVSLFASDDLVGNVAFGKVHGPWLDVLQG